MNISRTAVIHLLFVFGAYSQNSPLIYEDTVVLQNVRLSAAASEPVFTRAMKQLLNDAKKALSMAPLSVMDKSEIPPSGDKHDYMSLARYYWPDPKKPDGLPYISRDGEVNPDIDQNTDRRYLGRTIDAAHTLALAYYFTGDERFASKAALLLRVWFIDPATKMNPHFNFGQGVKGKDAGRPSGLIDARNIGKAGDAALLISGSSAWTEKEHTILVRWFDAFLEWLLTSKIGKGEAGATNNHGVWYDVQAASIAMFTGKTDVARKILEEAREKRIGKQIEPDGSMPRELARTLSIHYVHFNLEAFIQLAELGERAGVDLWKFSTADGRSIKAALMYVVPFIRGEKEWTYKQIGAYTWNEYYILFEKASMKYQENIFSDIAEKLKEKNASSERFHLLIGK